MPSTKSVASSQSGEISNPRYGLGIALTSSATLLLELSLTRLFSVVLFYHFAFLAISIALLGLGAGGVFAFTRKARLATWETTKLAQRLCLASAAAMLIALEVVLHVPVALNLTGGNFLRLTAVYLAAAVPFLFTGLMFSVIFAREPERISHLYGADLMGGATACLAVVPLLNLIGGPNAVVFAALAMAVAGALWSTANRRVALALAGIFALVIAANLALHGRLIDIVYAKGMRRDQPWVLYSKWNAISRVEVDQVGESKYIVIDADASTAIMNVDPHKWQDTVWQRDLMAAAPAVVNVLRPQGDYAIIGPGGGVDVLRAVANGSKNVTAIEINPIIADNIMRGSYADYAYHLYERPEVHLHVQDGRSFVRSSKDNYDVIQMTLVDTWASTAAGAFALSENNLYTVEAFKEYFDHLKPDGMIAITRWEFSEPREALRVVSQGIEALQEMGVTDAYKHLLVVADGELNQDGTPVAVLIKKSAFTAEELQPVWAFLIDRPNLHGVYPAAPAPGVREVNYEAALPFYSLIATGQDVFKSIFPSEPPGLQWSPRIPFIAQYPYDISPVHDDAPFFFFTFKTRRLFEQIWNGTGRGMDWRINLGVAVLFMLLVISLLAVAGFLILPLAFHAPARGIRMLPLFYFVAVGLGYILVEITFIQRLVLFLGHPTYALTVVIFLLLLSSGAGSVAARKLLDPWRRVLVPLLLVVAALVVYIPFLPGLLSAEVGLPFPVKLLISAALLAPLGFAMGMPFPTGLRALGGGESDSVEWAWAMNAASSVLGSVLAIVIAVHFGLGATLACGAVAYAVAAALTLSFRQPAARAA